GQVGIDVGVVKFDGGDDQLVRAVVQELRPLVEESGVVFVAFDDKFLASPQAVVATEILSLTADQKIRPPPRVLENPCQQRRRRCLAMRAGDDKRSVAGKKEFLERFRERAVRNLVVEHVFDLGIPTREGVADDDKVWLRLQMVLAEALLP